jgi:uncharacterized protein YdeI (BOF family)
MRKIFLLCAVTLAIASVFIWRVAATPKVFGSFAGAPKVEIATLIADPKGHMGKLLQIEGTITEQCKSMGCYFFFKSGKDELRVDLQEVAMTAPMREGRKARVEGQVVPYNDGYQFYASAVEFEK